MDFNAARDAFYEGRRTAMLPLAVNDIVSVKEGRMRGSRAWVISLQGVTPASYLIEYEDGSDEVLELGQLHHQ